MEYLENINRLIDAKTAENNYLAMQLMLNVLHYSFEEAYLKLKLDNQNDALLTLAIAEVQIDYKVDLQRIIYAPSSYADIERSIYFKGTLEPNSIQKLFADDDSIMGLGEFGSIENLVEIQEDLANLCPYVQALYERMEDW